MPAIDSNRPIIVTDSELNAMFLNSQNLQAVDLSNLGECDFIQDLKYNTIYILSNSLEFKKEASNILKAVSTKYSELILADFDGDISTWFANNNKSLFLSCAKRALNQLDTYSLQQDNRGVYRNNIKEDKKGNVTSERVDICDFNILEAKRIRYIDVDKEGIELTLKSSLGCVITRVGEVNVFNDVRSFKNFLASLELSFQGNLIDLVKLQQWVNNHFAIDVKDVYSGTQFINIDNKNVLLNNCKIVGADLKNIRVDSEEKFNIVDSEIENPELLISSLLNFAKTKDAYTILGTVIHNQMKLFADSSSVKMHHLNLIGESGSGKSTILENVIQPMLCLDKDSSIKAIGGLTKFAFINALSSGNYTCLLEEYKPSMLSQHQNSLISELMRNAYDKRDITRGKKDLTSVSFSLSRPVIVVGEENWHNNEIALIERSVTVYISRDRTKENEKSMLFLRKNSDDVYAFATKILKHILKMDINEYKTKRMVFEEMLIEDTVYNLKDRLRTTAASICVGMQVLSDFIETELGLNSIPDIFSTVCLNLKTENKVKASSVTEQMMVAINSLIEDNRITREQLIHTDRVTDELRLNVSVAIDAINRHKKDFGLNIIVLCKDDFEKQCFKNTLFKSKEHSKNVRFKGSNSVKRSPALNKDMLLKIEAYSLLDIDISSDNPFSKKAI